VKNVCSGRSSDLLPNFDQHGFLSNKYLLSNINSFHYINGKYRYTVCVLSSFEHLIEVCEPFIVLKETDAKLKT
jgi:hypothetical protein